jgi:hypothetical protein
MFEEEEAKLTAQIDEMAEATGGWRRMPDAAFYKLVGLYHNDPIMGGVLAKHEAFQTELERRVVEDIGQRTKRPEPTTWLGRSLRRIFKSVKT